MKPKIPQNGVELIEHERRRQIEEENRTPEHDLAANAKGELANAAASYAMVASAQSRSETMPGGIPDVITLAPVKHWPWRGAAWKPSNDRLRNLARAGALIAAEIDRLLAQGHSVPVQTNATPSTESLGLRVES